MGQPNFYLILALCGLDNNNNIYTQWHPQYHLYFIHLQDSYPSDHGTIRSLHFEELDDKRRSPCNNLSWKGIEWTVLNAHYRQFTAEGQFKRKAVQVRVVIQIQFFQILQCTCIKALPKLLYKRNTLLAEGDLYNSERSSYVYFLMKTNSFSCFLIQNFHARVFNSRIIYYSTTTAAFSGWHAKEKRSIWNLERAKPLWPFHQFKLIQYRLFLYIYIYIIPQLQHPNSRFGIMQRISRKRKSWSIQNTHLFVFQVLYATHLLEIVTLLCLIFRANYDITFSLVFL